MKIKNFLAMMVAAATLSVCVASCSEDDDDDNNSTTTTVSAAEAMAGTFSGDYILTVSTSSDTSNVEMTIKKIDDNTIQLVTPSAGSGAMALPTLTCDLKATAASGVYSASAETVSGSVMVNDVEKAYSFNNVAVVVSGNTAAVTYSLQYGKMPMAMNVSFKGVKK